MITYSDGNSVNLGIVVGKDGEKGDKGDKGDTGATGAQGIQGEKGDKGDTGAAGADGKDGIGVTKTGINEDGQLVVYYSDGNHDTLGVVVGEDGQDGAQGEKGDKGDTGAAGADGKDGIGVTKTEINEEGRLVVYYSDGSSDTLGVVVGEDGQDGAQGEKGDKGDKGDAGAAGADGEDGVGISKAEINDSGELILTFSNSYSINLGRIVGQNGADGAKGDKGEKGDTGETGAQGEKGEKGDKGADGVGIANVTITDEGALNVELTNGTVLQLGNIKGTDGIGITKSEINASGHLVLTYSDGNTADLGNVVGAAGADGENGVGIKTVTLSTAGDLSVTLTDNSVLNLGNVKGPKGDKGDTGAQGPQGATGAAGAQGEQGEKGEKGDTGEAGRGIDRMEINDAGELVVYYTDGTNQNLGNTGNDSGATVENTFIYSLLPDGTYSVSASDPSLLKGYIKIPSQYNGIPVTTIAPYGFSGSKNITELTIPSSIRNISANAFSSCVRLEKLNFEGDFEELYIGEYAFYDFGYIDGGELVFPEGLISIGKYAFEASYAPSDLKVTFPSSLVRIHEHAFSDGYKPFSQVYFKNPNGWVYYDENYPGNVTPIDSSELSDPSMAAEFMDRKSGYYTLERIE